MLQLRETRIVRTNHMPVVSAAVIPEEGMALVYAKELGLTKVQLSTGVAGEIFAGVSFSRNSHPGQVPYVQEQLVPANLTVTLVRAPIAGQLLVQLNGGEALRIVSASPAAANEVQLSGSNLVFFSGAAGALVSAQFLYVPTVVEARTFVGDAPIGGLASTAESVIGLLKDAQFSTNFFDASVDWSDALYVKLAAGGNFTVGTAADHVQNVVVYNAPNAANPFLALSATVA